MGGGLAAQLGAQVAILQQQLKLPGEIRLVATPKQEAGRSDGIGKAAAIGGQHHTAAGQPFQCHHPEGLTPAGGDHHQLVAVELPHQGLTLDCAQEVHKRADAQISGKPMQWLPLRPGADDGEVM